MKTIHASPVELRYREWRESIQPELPKLFDWENIALHFSFSEPERRPRFLGRRTCEGFRHKEVRRVNRKSL